MARLSTLCRDCGALEERAARPERCRVCGSPRLVAHAELTTLSIAHLDCDAFYASVEKRDNPALRDQPVVVGGSHRGVVMAACYIARISGVRSAMPMFQARKLCPQAVVVPPDMAKYQAVGEQVRLMMLATTPLVEPLSVDEAFLDLTGTERLHGNCPARTLAMLARRIETEIGVTVSIGLSYNKFLAKVASDLDKPRGFAVIGRGEAKTFLAAKPVGLIWGVGRALAARLAQDGIATIGQLQGMPDRDLVQRYGVIGNRLACFARGEDDRQVDPDAPLKSISAETTFDSDLSDGGALADTLWPLCERVAARLRDGGIAARTVVLKLKTADFRIITRRHRLPAPTRLAEVLYRTALPLLTAEADGRRFRLIGVGGIDLVDGKDADPGDLLDPAGRRLAEIERVVVTVRDRLGPDAIRKGRGLLQRPAARDGGRRR
ncbi:MAG TPA: DNA polymerase IV [Candidatus Acidoferrum sp.]|nr:DNA polymerase IV [Candidatus Acidoferrum sp.]